jgi:tRNA (adenine57-N1/adenine58-N1)-methyltransferase catalytic subunit
MKIIQENDLILIVYKERRYLKRLEPGKGFHGKGGILDFSSLVGHHYGLRLGDYDVFEPMLEDLIMYGVKRITQIVYPKDAAMIGLKLSLGYGSKVLEVGTGSGALTLLFSRLVGPAGMVVSFEKEERHFKNAQKNLEKLAKEKNMLLRNDDVSDYEGEIFDAAFIDVREPWFHMEKVRSLLKGGGPLGAIVPTANQVSDCLRGLEKGFGDIEVMEIMLRKYKTTAERLRPQDRMIGHTGYLLFARKIDAWVPPQNG